MRLTSSAATFFCTIASFHLHPFTTNAFTSNTAASAQSATTNLNKHHQQQQQDPRSLSTMTMSTGETISTVKQETGQEASSLTKTSYDNTQETLESIEAVQSALDNSWPRLLSPETEENIRKSRQFERISSTEEENKRKRPIYNGHYLVVKPTPLKNPRLVLLSQSVAQDLLHLGTSLLQSPDFVDFVSGNKVIGETWATPYALSIMAKRYTNNDPYGTDNGYGDGRAISIAEFNGYELQLKGAGTTPFHRGADGRAVLRSSIREFLASEAMHHLNVCTTRALSLVVSENGDTVQRPWYSDDARLRLPTMDDPRLAKYPVEQRKLIIQQLRTEKADPNILITEPCAITCRVSPSFVRIGHIDLFARRVEPKTIFQQKQTTIKWDTTTLQWKELEEIIWHACYREFKATAYDPYFASKDLKSAATVLLHESAEKIATMVADWIRVGFAQGNFNADNCLVAGRTMDYGPFGFMEEYNPLFAKWTGSGQHFGFMNQPNAGFANYNILVASVVPVLCVNEQGETIQDADDVAKPFLERGAKVFEDKVDQVFRVKLGFQPDDDVADELWNPLQSLMRKSRVDWIIFFRQLTYVARDFVVSSSATASQNNYDETTNVAVEMLKMIEGDETDRLGSSAFYEPLSEDLREEWITWLEQWREALLLSGDSNTAQTAYERMRLINPKFVLREWMMVEAYTDAADGNEQELYSLYDLIQHPYDEGSQEQVSKYYRRPPEELLTKGGTGFMSCSS